MARRHEGLTRPRLLGLGLILGLNIGLGVAVLRHYMTQTGNPLGGDFVAYWAAAKLALSGQASAVYDIVQLRVEEDAIQPGMTRHPAWFYPPFFLLLVLPLGLLSYGQALLAWLAGNLALYAFALRRWLPEPHALALLAFPGVWRNLLDGQNGLLTLSLAALVVAWQTAWPRRAGVALGLLLIKPHLGPLLLAWLVWQRAWRVIGTAAITALLLVAVSTALFGGEVWYAAREGLLHGRDYLTGGIPTHRLISVFGAVRSWGGGLTTAWLAQAVGVAVTLAMLVRIWTTTRSRALQVSAMATGTLLISPYLFDYDSAWLLLAIAAGLLHVVRQGTGWRPGERACLIALWLAPLYPQLLLNTVLGVSLQPVPWLCLCWLLLILYRIRHESRRDDAVR